MKLATLREGGRDGTLAVVDCLLKRATKVPLIANTLQNALDNWEQAEGRLKEVYEELNQNNGTKDSFDLEIEKLAAPLPRAYQWADGSAYVNHVELVRKARGAKMPENFWTDPLMYQGTSDSFISAVDAIYFETTDWGIDFEAEVAIITDDVPMGLKADQAESHIKLLGLVNDVSLRNLIPNELSKGFGFFQSKPASSFSPVFITPDELGDSWGDGKIRLPLRTYLNEKIFGEPDAGEDMTFNFFQLIEHAAKSRRLGAGTIIGSGTVSNLDRSKGSSCLAEKRMLEIIEKGKPETPFLEFGDRVRIEMTDNDGQNIFGSINQVVRQYIKQ